jgi:hypothetical protein
MPRAKPKTVSPVAWIGSALKLSPTAIKRLIDHAGLDATDASAENRERIKGLIMGVVEVLGQYQGMAEVLDRSPRPANIRAAVKPLQKRAGTLLTILDGLDAESWSLLKEAGWEPNATRAALFQLRMAAESICSRLTGRESRYAPRKDAARIIITDLARLYDHYSEPIAEEGGSVPLGASSKRRFVVTALRAGKIPAGHNLIDEALRSPQADLYRPRKQGVVDPSDRTTFVIMEPDKPPDQQLSLGRYLTVKEDQVLDQLRRLGFAPQGEERPSKADSSGGTV